MVHQLYDDKILHILVKARNNLRFIPATGFVIPREPSNLDALIEYCDNKMVALPPTHALDYPLPANTDGVAFAGPDTAFLDSIPRFVEGRYVGSILRGMDDFILFPLVQEKGCAALVHILSTNSWAGKTDWYDKSGDIPRAPAGYEENIRRDFNMIFENVARAIRKHPTNIPVITEGCTLLMLMHVMPTWSTLLKKSNIVKVLIAARLNFAYQPGGDSSAHRVPQALQRVLLAAQQYDPIEFGALEESCVSMARDVAGLTPSLSPLDYHNVRLRSVIDRGVHEHLWNDQYKTTFL